MEESDFFLSWASESDLIISEIMYDVSGADSGHEWVEFYNNGEDSLTVTSTWRFFDSSNHKINFYQGNSTVGSHEFFVLVDNAEQFLLDYPGFSGNLFDTVVNLPNSSSTIALSFDNGDSLALYDYYDSLWGANGDGYSLEKKDFYASSTDNWQVSGQLGGTPGQSNSLPVAAEELADEERPEPVINGADYIWSQLIINELLPNPTGSDDNEWVELYNIGPEILNLSDLQIKDATSRIFTLDSDSGLPMNLLANNYFLLPKDISGISLNNSSDELSIIDPDGNLIDSIIYDKAIEGQSYARSDSGFVWTKKPTPGSVNQIIVNQPPVAQISVEGDFQIDKKIDFSAEYSYDPEGDDLDYEWDFGDGKNSNRSEVKHSFEKAGSYTVVLVVTDAEGLVDKAYFVVDINAADSSLETEPVGSSAEQSINNFKFDLAEDDLMISEFIPNPEGSDDNEWIELYNASGQDIDLYNWYLDDEEGGSKMWRIATSTVIRSQGYLVFPRADTKITLNNSTDSVRLFTPSEEVWQEVSYEQIPEGQSYAFDNLNNEWFIASPSPGAVNIFETDKTAGIIYGVSDIDDLEKNDQIFIQGIVLNSPGSDERSLYLADYDFLQADFEAVAEIYSYYKNFPDIKAGQIITVSGQLSSLDYLPRVKIKSAEDIVANDMFINLSEPEEIWVDDISNYQLGSYIKIKGTVVKKNGQNIYLGGDKDGDYIVRIYSQFPIKDLDIAKGDEIIAKGILTDSNGNFKLLPLSDKDILVNKEVLGVKIENAVLGTDDISNSTVEVKQLARKEQVKNVLIYIVIFIGITSLIYYIKKRSALRA